MPLCCPMHFPAVIKDLQIALRRKADRKTIGLPLLKSSPASVPKYEVSASCCENTVAENTIEETKRNNFFVTTNPFCV